MRENRFKAWRAASVYMGVILGAGFASGQELLRYFVRFGAVGFIGLAVMGLILAFAGWAALDLCVRRELNSAADLMTSLFGKRLGTIMGGTSGIFIAVMYCTMNAGGGAIAREVFGVPFTAGVAIVAVLCFAIFLLDLRGIVRLNTIVSLLLVAGGIFFGLYTAVNHHAPVFYDGDSIRLDDSWIWSAATYAAYNTLTAVMVLAGLRRRGLVTDRRTARNAGLLGGLLMCALGVCFALPMFLYPDLTMGLELPLHRLAQESGQLIEGFYLLLLALAMFAAAVSNGFAVVEFLQSRLHVKPIAAKALVALGGACIAHLGFSVFITRLYPVFGIVGLFEIAVILIAFARQE